MKMWFKIFLALGSIGVLAEMMTSTRGRVVFYCAQYMVEMNLITFILLSIVIVYVLCKIIKIIKAMHL
jgi:uncharacterized protein HemY